MGIWSNLANSFSVGMAGDTPLYTLERDNSVANAYNNWLASEKNRMAQEEAQARQAELNAAAYQAQAEAQAAMNQYNMDKYAQAEAQKAVAENAQYYIDAYNKLSSEYSAIDAKLASNAPNTDKAGLKAKQDEIKKAMNQVAQYLPQGLAEASQYGMAAGDAQVAGYNAQKAANQANAQAKNIQDAQDLVSHKKKFNKARITELKNAELIAWNADTDWYELKSK